MAPDGAVVSPELVLVSPPELAAAARAALPDYPAEQSVWLRNLRAAMDEELRERTRHRSRRERVYGLLFAGVMMLNCAAALIVPILFR